MDVAVLGAGGRGRDIARICAVADHDVRLYAEDVDAVMDGIDRIGATLSDASGGDTPADSESAADRIDGTTGLEAAVADADVVLDATDDAGDERRSRFAEIEGLADGDAVLSLCGSTLSVTAVAAGLRQPGRALGLHFVGRPAAPLVEIAVADQTTEPTRETAESFVASLERESVVVRDVPGFAATRLTLALSVEAMRMVEDRVAGIEAIDRTLEAGHDFPIGPLAAADAAGLDDRLAELEYLTEALGDRFDPPPVLRDKVAAGDLGRATGEGFYVWEDGDPTEAAAPDPTPDLRADEPVDPDGR